MKFLWLIFWIGLALALCLMPSSCFAWFSSVVPSDSGTHLAWPFGDLVEGAAHAILIAGIAFHLVPMFGSSVRKIFSLMGTMLVVLLIAISIEWLQGLLPENFHRGPAASDIWASLVGGALGALVGLFYHQLNPHEAMENNEHPLK